jgi:hypothetical protein
MVKKKGYRPKGLIQILAAIGLVIAILWIAKGMFHFGSAGLPTLKCVPSDNSDSIIYDLAEDLKNSHNIFHIIFEEYFYNSFQNTLSLSLNVRLKVKLFNILL